MFHFLSLRNALYLYGKPINVHLLVYHVSTESFQGLSAQYLDVLRDKMNKTTGHLAIRPRLKPSPLFQTNPHLLPPEQPRFTAP
jgi:hypothetical protein